MDEIKTWTCKNCGRIFYKRHSLIGHQRTCKPDNPKYGGNNKSKISQFNGICPFCKKEYKTNSGLARHIRICKQNPDFDYDFYKKNYLDFVPWNKGLTIKTDERVLKSRNKLKEGYDSGKWISPQKGKPRTDEEKLKTSISIKNYLDNHPELSHYGLLKTGVSYPEQYFKEVFERENIPLKFHLKVKRYELDFYNKDLKKYVEIDGEQHYTEQGIKHDLERTEFLSNLGWEGKRIRWKEYRNSTCEEKDKIIKDIKDFLNCN